MSAIRDISYHYPWTDASRWPGNQFDFPKHEFTLSCWNCMEEIPLYVVNGFVAITEVNGWRFIERHWICPKCQREDDPPAMRAENV